MNGCRYIVDITADQFGLPPVIVVDVIEDSLRYSPGLQAAVDAHVNDLRRELEKQRHVDASTLQPGVAPGTSSVLWEHVEYQRRKNLIACFHADKFFNLPDPLNCLPINLYAS